MSLPDATFVFDARGVAKRFRHAAIFGALESLHNGEAMRFVNDHDPLPLLEQIRTRYGHQISYRYVDRTADGVVIDFAVSLPEIAEPQNAGGGCGGTGGGCGCSGH